MDPQREGFSGDEKMDTVKCGDAFHLVAEGIGQRHSAMASLVKPCAVEVVDKKDKGFDNQ